MTAHKFPPTGFLVLGILTVAASILFVVRSVGVEATTQRVWSAVIFGVMGVVFLVAYWASRHSSTH